MYEPPIEGPYPPPWYGERDHLRYPGPRSPDGRAYSGSEGNTLPGSLLLLAGLLGLIYGIVLLFWTDWMVTALEDTGTKTSGEMIFYTAIVFLILAMFPLIGGLLYMVGGRTRIVKVMAGIGVISLGPILISSILSLIALILLVRNKKPSIRGPGGRDRYMYGPGPVPPSYGGPEEYPPYDGPYPGDPYYPPYPWGPFPYDDHLADASHVPGKRPPARPKVAVRKTSRSGDAPRPVISPRKKVVKGSKQGTGGSRPVEPRDRSK